MKRSTYLTLAVVTFALILLTFVVRGTTRLVVGDRNAALLSLPVGISAVALLIVLVSVAVLDRTGLWTLEDDLDK